ncbi:MAG TPA: TIGR02594 family protein [Methylocystis sp.]|jgi:uncharacterized protein (TIGR02594 family)
MSTPWLTVSLSFMNKKEVPGPSSNPDLIEMYRLCGHKQQDDAVPWCAAFVGACLSLAGYKNSGSLMARSYENFGRNLWGAPERGAIVVFPRGPASSGQGHVGFVERVEGDQIVYVSGNLSDMVKRDTRAKSEMIACCMPTETAPLPQTSLPTILQIAPQEAPPHLRGVASGEIILPRPGEREASDELMEGAGGPEVESLQRALRDAGFSPGEIDGEYGPNTRNAIGAFQSSRRLPVTGVADERTLSLLNIPALTPNPIFIGRQDVQRREEREQFLERVIAQLINTSGRQEVSPPETSAGDLLSNLIRQAVAAKSNGQASGGSATADAILQQLLQTALPQVPGAKPVVNGVSPTPADIAKTLPMSPIDKVLGGEALVGMKTPLAVGAYTALSIFQSLGIAGP